MINALIDAGPIIALFDRDDQHHERVLRYMQDFQGRLLTTWPVLTEVSYMLDFSLQSQLDFFDWISEGGIQLCNLEQWQLKRVREIMDKYADLPADFADATLIVTAESMKVKNILTIDGDFNVYRLVSGVALTNLLG
ncbi:MAG: PIN domain-containing protein [Balneolaceae bacterium]